MVQIRQISSKKYIRFLVLLAEQLKSNTRVCDEKRRRKYQHRFNKCLAELTENYPVIPAHEYIVSSGFLSTCFELYILKYLFVER